MTAVDISRSRYTEPQMIQVFKRPSYLVLALIVAFGSYLFVAWIPLRSLILQVDLSTAMRLLLSAPFDVHIADALYPIIFSILIGINVSLLLFYLKTYGLHSKTGATTAALGTLTGILGFGCAACGSLFFTALVASIAGVGIAAALPVNGFVFQAAGVALLAFSIIRLSHSITRPHTCSIDEIKSS